MYKIKYFHVYIKYLIQLKQLQFHHLKKLKYTKKEFE